MVMQINLGCGFVTPRNWVNVDASLGARVAKFRPAALMAQRFNLIEGVWDPRIVIQDLNKPLMFADNSACAIYFSHTLEHLSGPNGHSILLECRRVLRAGGTLRVVVPDLRRIVETYVSGQIPATQFLDKLYVLYPEHPNPLKEFALKWLSFPHKVMYDEVSLREALKMAGFGKIQRCQPFESRITAITDVEREAAARNSLILEATKPNSVPKSELTGMALPL